MVESYTALVLRVGWPLISEREDMKTIAIPHIRQMVNLGLPAAG